MAKTYRNRPKTKVRKPRTRREYIDNLSSLEELREYGFEPDNRTVRKASAPVADEKDWMNFSALEDKHNLI